MQPKEEDELIAIPQSGIVEDGKLNLFVKQEPSLPKSLGVKKEIPKATGSHNPVSQSQPVYVNCRKEHGGA